MFIILLISSALGACKDIKVEKDCWADSKCIWDDDEDDPRCYDSGCDAAPMKGWCESGGDCEWKDGKCSSIDCIRYPGNKCPTKDKDCKVYTFKQGTYCIPKSYTPTATDNCPMYVSVFSCKQSGECVWKDNKCKYNGCSREEPTADKCKESDGCKIFPEGEEEEERKYCAPKGYDPETSYCSIFSEGTECNSVPDCMTVSGKCKEDECLSVETTKEECEKGTGCTWGTPEVLKDWLDGKKACYHKDHEFEAGALGVIPALVQNKFFQLASALLLFLLI